MLGMSMAPAHAQYREDATSGLVGIKAGLFSRTNIDGETTTDGENVSFRTQVGSSAQLYADFTLFSKTYLSTSFDFYYVQIVRNNQIMLEGSLGLKRMINLGFRKTRFKPGVAVGFAYLSRIGDLKSTDFVTVKGTLETHFIMTPRRTWLLELALIQSVSGGNSRYDLEFGPSLLVRVGLTFR